MLAMGVRLAIAGRCYAYARTVEPTAAKIQRAAFLRILHSWVMLLINRAD
jgi:hypothetical protein